MKNHPPNIGIMSREDYRRRTIAIAKGLYKVEKGEHTDGR